MTTIKDILKENKRRQKEQASRRKKLMGKLPETDGPIDIERCRKDFRYWAARAVTIRDKRTGHEVPFILNQAQCRVLKEMEAQRLAGKPIRIILLKARQWGGSTLIQVYMAWIQLIHRKNWHSVICAHVKDAAKNILGMYTTLLGDYPKELVDKKDGAVKYSFRGFERTQNVREISGRKCRVAVASAESYNSVRGSDIAMAQLSEVAYWKDTTKRDPEDFLRAVCSSVPLEPYTLVAVESTANGVGNFFHREWERALSGQSDKKAIFVPWYEIEMYTKPVEDAEALWKTFTAYEAKLWNDFGCTLEQICWYRHRLSEMSKPELMQAEFPTTPTEAFVMSDSNVFSAQAVEALRQHCRRGRTGELNEYDNFIDSQNGGMTMWEDVKDNESYIVAVDVGGRTERADWSVVAVLKYGERPEVVAQWRGHIDHDLLARRAVKIASYYNEALLVIESNTLESADESTSSSMVLRRVAESYWNTYQREESRNSGPGHNNIGFHTNSQTKAMLIDFLTEYVRDGKYIERDMMACDELMTYCRLPNGSYAARRGCHDDILMTRALALLVMEERPQEAMGDLMPIIVTGGCW